VFLVVEYVDALRVELVAKGVAVALEPTDQSWAIGRRTWRTLMATAFVSSTGAVANNGINRSRRSGPSAYQWLFWTMLNSIS